MSGRNCPGLRSEIGAVSGNERKCPGKRLNLRDELARHRGDDVLNEGVLGARVNLAVVAEFATLGLVSVRFT